MKKSHLGIAAAVLAVAAVVIFVLTRGGDDAANSADGETAGASGGAGSATAPGIRGRGGPGANKGAAGSAKPLAMSAAPGYPPGSRPAVPGKRTDMFLNAGPERIGRVGPPPRAGEAPKSVAPEDEPVSYVLWTDKYAVVADEPLNVMFALHRGDPKEPRTRFEPVITAAHVTTKPTSGNQGRTVAQLAFNDEGRDGDATAGDLVYTSRIVPSKTSIGNTPGMYFPVVEFRVDGKTTRGRISFVYTIEDDVPARFTGKISDKQVNGSLEITAELQVTHPGEYTIEGAMFSEAGKPIGVATYRGRIDIGRTQVALTFYGLMFRGAGDGPYVLRHLRGYRTNGEETPPRKDMPMYVGGYRTADYLADSFTDEKVEGGGFY